MSSPLKIAAVITTFFPRSHADVIVTRWFTRRPADADWGWPGPRNSRIASMVVEQFHEKDMARALCAEHEVPLFDSVAGALTLGGEKLAVDAVLLIGEHGEYPLNELGQKEYPRKQLFDQIVEVFEASGHAVPVFCDKHYSWNFAWAREMFDTARARGFLLFGGSSIPHCPRRPPLPLPLGSAIEEAVCVFYGGAESYGYHSLEFGQSLVERRAGGESGIRSITVYKGESVWEQLDRGRWSKETMEAAIAVAWGLQEGDYRENCAKSGDDPMAFCLEHEDGLKVTHVRLNGHVRGFSAAVRLAGEREPRATNAFMGEQDVHFAHFATLARLIEDGFVSGKPPVAPERNLLTTGATAAVMRALAQPGEPLATPELNLPYQAADYTGSFSLNEPAG